MSERQPPLLSDLVADSERALAGRGGSRRDFLARTSALGLVVGGSALLGCRARDGQGADTAGQRTATAGGDVAQAPSFNANSRLDTALHDPADHATRSSIAVTPGPLDDIPLTRYDPALPPLSQERTLRLHWRAQELPVRISADTVVAGWTFEGNIPGPIVHCRVGDTIEFTLTNEGLFPHSMDFHAAQIDPKVAFRSVGRNETVEFTFQPRWAGAYMYHCGTAPVLLHIGSGMYGAIIVSPREPLPLAREFVLVQSEYYLGEATENGIRPFAYDKMLGTLPDFLAFNGRPSQYIADPIRVRVGERVRFWVVNCGPTHPCAFHVVGEQFDRMYLGSPPETPLRGVQTWDVPAGGGVCFELQCDIPGEFPFVNHGFGHGQKGAIGFLVVEE